MAVFVRSNPSTPYLANRFLYSSSSFTTFNSASAICVFVVAETKKKGCSSGWELRLCWRHSVQWDMLEEVETWITIWWPVVSRIVVPKIVKFWWSAFKLWWIHFGVFLCRKVLSRLLWFRGAMTLVNYSCRLTYTFQVAQLKCVDVTDRRANGQRWQYCTLRLALKPQSWSIRHWESIPGSRVLTTIGWTGHGPHEHMTWSSSACWWCSDVHSLRTLESTAAASTTLLSTIQMLSTFDTKRTANRHLYNFISLKHACHYPLLELYCVSEKNSQNCFCHKFVKFQLTLILFGKNMAKTVKLWHCKMYSFSISPNFCYR